MRFAGVVLFFLALSSSAVKSVVGQSKCSDELGGIENAGICCAATCGSCGGRGCRSRMGGEENCCTGYIATNGAPCSETNAPPCIIDDDDTMPNTCTNGLTGFSTGDICCAEECGRCGGSGCRTLQGGAASCCSGVIADSGVLCSDSRAAPCIMTPAPTPATVCSNGVAGVNDVTGEFCCAAECGTCGGNGCRTRPGGPDNCCTGVIADSGADCSTTREAPCRITSDPVPCSNDIAGVETDSVCCLEECGVCGGPGCGRRPGGPEGCCRGLITDSCNATMAAPCIID